MENDSNIDVNPESVAEDTSSVQPTPTYTNSAAEPVTPIQKKRSPRLIVGGAIAAALLLLGGGSALAYTMYYQNPDKVVHDAILNAIQAKTMSTQGTITYKDQGINVDLALSSNANQTDSEFSVQAKVAIDTDEMRQDFEADGLGKIIGDTLYFKLAGVKEIAEDVASESQGQLPPYAADIIAKIDNRWISVKASDYADIYEDLSRQQTCFTDLSKKIQSDKGMVNELSNLYGKNKVVSISEDLGSKNINGVGSLGYKVDINQEAAAAFVRGLEGTKLGNELKSCEENINFADVANGLAEETEEAEHVPTLELWVSRFGHEITKFSIYGKTSDDGNLNIELLPVFNNSVTIETPADVAPFETVMEDIRAVISEYSASEPAFDSSTMPADMDFYDDIDYSAV